MRACAAAGLGLAAATALAQAPSYETRQQVQRSLVQVSAFDCEGGGGNRKGSGFTLDHPGQIVTAHHVVGGCKGFNVLYQGAPANAGRERPATLARIVAAGDLGLLRVEAPPQVPVLRLSTTPPARDQGHAGFGFGLGAQTASDKGVRFSSGATRLRDILPPAAAQELAAGSPVALDAEVLRLDAPLEPGMSGGPIVNAAGEVVGVVAGGLKAGASTASWGWPGEGVRRLLVSAEPVHRPLRNTGLFYSEQDFTQISRALKDGRRLRCGELEFADTGERPLSELMRGADDGPRLQHLLGLTRENPQLLGAESYRVWVSQPSGATVLMPPGVALQRDGEVCTARSADGAVRQLVWGAVAPTPMAMQARSLEFEQRIVTPRVPAAFGFQLDPHLTTFTYPNVPGPLMQANGMLFNRKGFSYATQPQRFPGEAVPFAHLFLTLATGPKSFLGVATVNPRVHPFLQACAMDNTALPGCVDAAAHQRTWTRFVLSTQLSTFPVY